MDKIPSLSFTGQAYALDLFIEDYIKHYWEMFIAKYLVYFYRIRSNFIKFFSYRI